MFTFPQIYREDFRDQGHKVLDTWRSLHFFRTGRDLKVAVSDISAPWRLSEVCSEEEVRNFCSGDL